MPRPRSLRSTYAVTVLASLLTLTGCGDDPNAVGTSDVAYATDLTRHHAQTLQVLDVSLGQPSVGADLGSFADRTRTHLFGEVETTQSWLEKWDEPVPATALQHTHDEDPDYDTSAPGMLDEADLHRLQQRRGPGFADVWVRHLVALEEGAVQLAEAAVAEARNAEVKEFAEQDLAFHRKQLEDLRAAQ
jgi:uncharacterized protein (DUF305 family)